MNAFTKIAWIAAAGLVFGAGAAAVFRVGANGPANAYVGAPVRLVIPRIGVDAPVKPVGVNAAGNLGVPSDAVHVAWYKYGPRPGAPGTAVIDGHLDTKGVPQAVFYDLNKLSPGDSIEVETADGRTLTFKVTATKTFAYDASDAQIKSLFASSGTAPGLNLITCAGDWMPGQKMYNERFAVFAKLYD